jgi:hypothetical protein
VPVQVRCTPNPGMLRRPDRILDEHPDADLKSQDRRPTRPREWQ